MKSVRHGLSVGIDRIGRHFFLHMKIAGRLTHDDYQIMVPMLESAISGIKHPHINALVDITELEGWDLRAAWDDLKLGFMHGGEFDKIAVVGNKRWMKLATAVGSWFLTGNAEFFSDRDNAVSWLSEEEREHIAI